MDYIYILKFIGVITSMFLVDICWARYFIYVGKHNPLLAAFWGTSILLLGSFTTINYVSDKTLLIAAIIGSFCGTFWVVNKEKQKAKKEEEKKVKK